MIRIFIAVRTPLYALGNMMHDDYLLVEYADSLQSFRWLGAYNNRTLTKGISFSVFLVFSYLCHLPYTWGLILLWILSIVVFIIAIKKKIHNKYILAGIYLFLLYSPAMFATSYAQRIYRMAVVPSAVLLVVACLVGLFFRKEEKGKTQIIWSVGAGLSFSFFWYIREDSIWLMPFVLGALVCTFVGSIYKKHFAKKKILQKIGICSVPIICLICTTVLISTINLACYGIYTVNDRTNTHFSELMSTLLKLECEYEDETVWIPRTLVEEVLEVSPTLQSIEPQIDQIYESGWSVNGEIQGDIFFWAIRDAVAWAGYYTSAETANEFYRMANEELQTAIEDGRLEKRDAIYVSSLGKGLTEEDVPFLVDRILENFKDIITYSQCKTELLDGKGTWEQIRKMEIMTNSPVIYPTQVSYTVSGEMQYAVASNFMKVYAKNSANESVEIPEGSFGFDMSLVDDMKFEIYESNNLVAVVDKNDLENEYCTIKINNIETKEIKDPVVEKGENAATLSNFIIKIYQKLSVVIAVLAFVGYVSVFVKMIVEIKNKKYGYLEIFLIMTGLLISGFALLFGVSWFTSWISDYRFYTFFYTAGLLVLTQLFEVLGIIFGVNALCKNKNSIKL